jgi:hypothetical protein
LQHVAVLFECLGSFDAFIKNFHKSAWITLVGSVGIQNPQITGDFGEIFLDAKTPGVAVSKLLHLLWSEGIQIELFWGAEMLHSHCGLELVVICGCWDFFKIRVEAFIATEK